jgi:hypothetical protein
MMNVIKTGSLEEPAPGIAQWRELYAAAAQFHQIGCWRWLSDADLIGVRDPDTGVIGYCSVFGNAGRMFALAVYPGEAGLASFRQTQLAQGELLDELMLSQCCLIASFGERALLEKPDLTVIKQLGLKFRGAHAWPQFRSYRPGYAPWYLTAAEATVLTVALQQVAIVGQRVRDDLNFQLRCEQDEMLLRECDRTGPARPWWEQWVKLPANVPPPAPPALPPLEAATLQPLRRLPLAADQAWELDVFPAPCLISPPGQRPYIPQMLLCVDRASGFILMIHIAETTSHWNQFYRQLVQTLKATRTRPATWRVQRQSVLQWLRPLAEAIGTTVNLAPSLPSLNEARAGLAEMMPHRR